MEDGAEIERRRVPRILRRLLLLGVLAVAVVVFLLDRQVVRGFGDARWRHPVRIYAAPVAIEVGADLDAAGITAELHELGYRAVPGRPEEPGTLRRGAQRLEIFLNPAPRRDGFGEEPARRVTLELDAGRRVRAIDDDGARVEEVKLEPRALEGLFTSHWTGRRPLKLEDVPTSVVDAVLAAEDYRFLAHHGIDLGAVLRAARVNWLAGEVRQGGSTITQQIVKNHFLTQERTFSRKLREIPMALLLELRFDKREILECYLATVYLGHDRLVGVYGLAEAAQVYFGKPVSKLTLAEGATLAGMIRAPNIYSPLRHPEQAVRRRNQVLDVLEELEWITPEQAKAARAERLSPPAGRSAPSEAYFMQHARRALRDGALDPERLAFGSEVFTTLDPRLQRFASEAVEAAGKRIDGNRKAKRGGVQIAVVALDPRDGAIRALVGGRDFLASQLDRATRSRRPVGSLFKPFVYLAAIADRGSGVTPATILLDEPITLRVDRTTWSPKNMDERYRGPVTVRAALEQSLNVPVVQLAESLGVERVAAFGERLGLTSGSLPRVPALALGAFESSLLRVAAAYTVFPRGGDRVTPHAIASVKAPSGVVLMRGDDATHDVVRRAPAYVVHAMLEGVVDHGTAASIRRAGLRGSFAGKTGTTDDMRDAWFVGYSPTLVVGVWVGHDDDRPLPGGSTQLAVPIWTSIMKRALEGRPRDRFAVPAGVELVSVEAATGKRAHPSCGPAITEVFLDGTAPSESCARDARRVVAQGGDGSPVKQIQERVEEWFAALPRRIGELFGGGDRADR